LLHTTNVRHTAYSAAHRERSGDEERREERDGGEASANSRAS